MICFIITLKFQEALIAACDKRNDNVGEDVKQRVIETPDLSALDAIYHKGCDSNFRNQKQIPHRHQEQPQMRIKLITGHPVDDS